MDEFTSSFLDTVQELALMKVESLDLANKRKDHAILFNHTNDGWSATLVVWDLETA